MKHFCLFQPVLALQGFPEEAKAEAIRLPLLRRKQLLSVYDVLRLTADRYPTWPLQTVYLLKLTPWHWEAEEALRSKVIVSAQEAFSLYRQSLAVNGRHELTRLGLRT